jgi:hypothetical protein
LGSVARTPAIITQIRVGQQLSTTNWATSAEFDRLGREKALEIPGILSRLWASAGGSRYLHGRVSRSYLASAVWNLKRGRWLTALSRLFSLAVFGAPFVLSAEFWTGFRTGMYRLGESRRTREPAGSALIPVILAGAGLCLLGALAVRRLRGK